MRLSLYPALAATLLGATTIHTQNSNSLERGVQAAATSNENLNPDPLRNKVQTVALGDKIQIHAVPLKLEEMVSASKKIFSGECTEIKEVKEDPTKISFIEFTFKVDKGIKGVEGKEVKFKQYNRLPGYDKGQKYVLFLPSPGKLDLLYPIGGDQGRLQIYKKDKGKEEFVTYKGNEIRLEDFRNTVQDIIDIQAILDKDLLDKQKKK